ncbi:MAG: rubredoxin [Bacteroidales bacterium]|nr:rubredoxin [Bacteroidales bacterium]MBS7317598.1 rubredoxin [Bacteroidales bacterium]
MTKYRCRICGHVYDPEKGDPSQGIHPGTPFNELPPNWKCPRCKVGKENFEPMI